MVVEFTISYAISSYHHYSNIDSTLCDKVVSDLSSPGTPVSSTKKADRYDIAEILLIVALITI
jgi:hypothetical protein